MAVNYDLNNTGPEVQSRLDQVFPNKSDIDTLGVRVDGHDADIAELNNEIDALEKQDVIPVDTLPSVSEADPKTIYRVAAEDSYTDYMVNASGDGWKELAEFSFPGIDEEPTAGSDNLVKSGGVIIGLEETSQLSSKGIWLYRNHYIARGTPSGINHYLTESDIFDLLVIPVPSYAQTLSIGGLPNGATTYGTDTWDTFDISKWDSSYEGEHFVTTGWSAFESHPEIKVATVNLKRTENPDGYNNLYPIWTIKGVDEVPTAISKNLITSNAVFDIAAKKVTPVSVVSGTKKTGYIRTTGVIESASDYIHYVFEVTVGDEYHIHVPPYTQSSELQIAWFITSADPVDETTQYTIRAIDGGKITKATTLDLYVKVPSGVTAIGITSREQATAAPSVTEVNIEVEDVNTFLRDYQWKSGTLKVTKTGTNVYVRTKYDSSNDLLIHFIQDSNQCMKPNVSYLGSNLLSDSDLMHSEQVSSGGSTTTVYPYRFHVWSDSNAPFISLTHKASPWHLFANHGLYVPCMKTLEALLTSADVGSTWKDQLDRTFILGYVNSTDTAPYVVLIPTVTESSTPGDYTWSWVDGDTLPTSLTHVSGATHTSDVTLDGRRVNSYQIEPVQESIDRTFMCDGIPVTEDGTFYCEEFNINETLIGLNPAKVTNWWDSNGKLKPQRPENGEMVRLLYSYTFSEMSIRFDVGVNIQYPLRCDFFGGNQAQHTLTARYSDEDTYDIYVFAPRSKHGIIVNRVPDTSRVTDTPFKNNPSDSSSRSIVCYRNDVSCRDADKMPDRLVSYLQSHDDSTDKLIGFASGLSLTRGMTVDSVRNTLIPSGSQCYNNSIGQNNKMYITAISSDTYTGNLLPTTLVGTISSYFSYYDPNANEGQVYWYKDGNGYVVYAHSQTASSKRALSLSKSMEGLSVEVVDTTEGMGLLTDVVVNGKVYVSADNAQNNYIVLKLS